MTGGGASEPGGPEEGCVHHEGPVLSRWVQTHWPHSRLSGSARERQRGIMGRSLKIPVGQPWTSDLPFLTSVALSIKWQ